MVQANEYPKMDPLTLVVLRMVWKMDTGPGLIKEELSKTRGYGKMGSQYFRKTKRTDKYAKRLVYPEYKKSVS